MDPTPQYWPNPPVRPPPPRPQPLRFRPDGWVLALAVLTSLGLLVTVALWTYLAYRMVKSRSRLRSVWPGQVLLGGLVLSYALLFTFLPRPTPATCGLLRFGVGFVYAVCFGTLLLKLSITIARHRGVFLPVTVEMLLLALTISVQVAINSTWLITKNPVSVFRVFPDGSTSCNISIAEWVHSLGWVQVLLGVGVIASVAARRIKDNHREPVFIGLAFGFSLPLWIVWTLLATLLRSNSPIEEQCLAFGLLANATLILFAMFIPKVRQLSAIGAVGLYREDRPIPKPMTEMTVQKIYYPVYPENGSRQTQLDVGRYMRHLYGTNGPFAPSTVPSPEPVHLPRYYHYPHDEMDLNVAGLGAGPSATNPRVAHRPRRATPAPPPADDASTTASYRESGAEDSEDVPEEEEEDAVHDYTRRNRPAPPVPTYARVNKHMVY